ncbi:hypothetical protein Mpal_0909 [Methanosphaerula palustris E1-9c]|uniref:Uncharacterized protein n=2 Tax=Methanosphaerula palustris TaxID=475088 RepID=B8GGK8_METPE|nr:hypothetical protein Mpal_0909 [Methanosphaerula palustris E1-9c]
MNPWRITRAAGFVTATLAGIAILEASELGFSLRGSHSVGETCLVQIVSTRSGHPTTLISPAASARIIPASLALFSRLAPTGARRQDRRVMDAGVTPGSPTGSAETSTRPKRRLFTRTKTSLPSTRSSSR